MAWLTTFAAHAIAAPPPLPDAGPSPGPDAPIATPGRGADPVAAVPGTGRGTVSDAAAGAAVDLSGLGTPATPAAAGGSAGPPQVRVGDLQSQTDFFPRVADPGEPGRALTVTPSIGVALLGTDNVFQTARRRADLVTSVSPGLLATADTVRLQGVLNYAPNLQFYARTRGQDRVDHQLNGQGLITVVPDRLYVDVRAVLATQTATGGFAPSGTAVVDQRNRIQTSSFQISPYYLHRFGDVGTLQAGYVLQHASQDGDAAAVQNAALPYFTNQSFTANEGFGVFRTGEALGRLTLEGRLDGTAYTGTGVLDNAHTAFATVEARYALLRSVAGLVMVGYENQEYSGTPRTRINEPIWAVGGQWTPNADSMVTARYGRRDGFDAFQLDGGLSVGGRTRIGAAYSDRLSTSTRLTQDLLATTRVDAQGRALDSLTGNPQLLADSLLAVQSGLLRLRRMTASITHTWPRDRVTLAVFHERQTPIAAAAGTVPFAQRGTSGSVTLAHEVSPRTTAVGYVQYGRFTNPATGSGDVVTASASLIYAFSPTLTGNVQYVLTNRGADQPVNRSLQNVFLIGVRKSF